MGIFLFEVASAVDSVGGVILLLVAVMRAIDVPASDEKKPDVTFEWCA